MDKIDKAIASTQQGPGTLNASLELSNGREVKVSVPADIGPVELLAVVQFLTGPMQARLAQIRQTGPGIVVPRPSVRLPRPPHA